MNDAQKRLVVESIAGLLLFFGVAFFESWLRRHSIAAGILWFAVGIAAVIYIHRNRIVYSPADGRARTLETIKRHPIVKAWLILCTFVAAIVLPLIEFGLLRPPAEVSFAYLITVIAIYVGPLIFVTVQDRFRELAGPPDHGDGKVEGDIPG